MIAGGTQTKFLHEKAVLKATEIIMEAGVRPFPTQDTSCSFHKLHIIKKLVLDTTSLVQTLLFHMQI
jgi:hypothetical protein